MSEVFAIGLDSMHQDMRRVEQVAMNLANATTPGYRRQAVVAHPFATVVDRLGAAGADTAAPTPLHAPVTTFTDTHNGALRATGGGLDLALDGDGYFEVATAHGPAYTRQGRLHLDARGRLVTPQGDPVMGVGGEIVLSDASVTIDADGNIFAGKEQGDPSKALARLRIVNFEDAQHAQSLGQGLLALPQGTGQLTDSKARLRQGHLEASNVNTQQEMLELMQAMRHFEAVQRAVQGYDELLGTAIRKLGDV